MTGIDPTTCKPGAYRIRIGDRDVNALLLPNGSRRWAAPSGHALSIAGVEFLPHAEVTVLHRLVPESEEKTLDVPMQPWDVLRQANQIGVENHIWMSRSPSAEEIAKLADRLEAEHRAAQEKKAAADAARQALIAKAARIQCDGFYGPGAFDDSDPADPIRKRYIEDCARLADAGLLADQGGAQ